MGGGAFISNIFAPQYYYTIVVRSFFTRLCKLILISSADIILSICLAQFREEEVSLREE